MSRPRIRQPRVAEIVAARLREDILSGRLRVFSAGDRDREITYGVYGPAEYLGEMSLDGGPRSASVETLESSTCAARFSARPCARLAPVCVPHGRTGRPRWCRIWRLLSRSRSTTTTTPRSTCRTHGGFTKSWSPGAEMSR